MGLLTCQAGFESLLAGEAVSEGLAAVETGQGWLLAEGETHGKAEWCFAQVALRAPVQIHGQSVNALASAAVERFAVSARGERFESPWPLVVLAGTGVEGLGRRAASVEAAVRTGLQKRMARVARLASEPVPRSGNARGLVAVLVDFDRGFFAREAWFGGQRRMADDAAAPSRSYLKVEEAYGLLEREPRPGESVVDLGAAPGGWSYSAARRGALVVAVDNGPLKQGARGHPGIEHVRADAFGFLAPGDRAVDWLFCDMVEDPHRVLREILMPWVERRACRRFVVNLKFGRADALVLLAEVRAQLQPHCVRLVVRHLFHDREEFTVAGATAGWRA